MSNLDIETVSIQGQKHSFSHQAILQICQPKQILYRTSFFDAFHDIKHGRADLAVIPIENSTHGSVYENYDHLSANHCRIVAETYVRVELNIMGLPGVNLKDIKRVYSHPVALQQIQGFKYSNSHLEFASFHDTAGAAIKIKEENNPAWAACASQLVADSLGLQVLKQNIGDNPRNFTRFFALTCNAKIDVPQDSNKTTIQFELGDEAGSLYKTLRGFADRDLSLSRIESRPIINTDWRYRFYLDILAGITEDSLRHALSEIEDYVRDGKVRILGSYHSDSSRFKRVSESG